MPVHRPDLLLFRAKRFDDYKSCGSSVRAALQQEVTDIMVRGGVWFVAAAGRMLGVLSHCQQPGGSGCGWQPTILPVCLPT